MQKKRHSYLRMRWRILPLFFLISIFSAQAAITLGLTRTIVTGDDNSGSVQVKNEGSRPALIQTWIDNGHGEMDKPPESIQVPFAIDTPVFRLEGKKAKRVRIFFTGKGRSLPSDRESLFWLNVLEVPPKSEQQGAPANEVQIAFQSRTKLFFRPKAIPSGAYQVEKLIRFELISGNKLKITNPTPYYVTFMTLEISRNNGTQSLPLVVMPDDMIKPKASVTVPIQTPYTYQTGEAKVRFAVIDDYGSTLQNEQSL